MRGNWNYPTSVRFGAGRVAELPAACDELGIYRPLVITDPGLAELPPTRATLDALSDRKVGLWSGAQPNPAGADVEAGVAAYHEGDHDGVVALGGGSAMDVAKAVALMVGQSRPLWDFEDIGDNWTRVDEDGLAPLVAVPTTAGTGSEVGRASVIINPEQRKKAIIFHPKMLPARVICDPALTVGLPAHITAWVGIDALSHNLEAFCAPGFHPQADGIAVEGIRLVRAALERAVTDGADLNARAQMMAASMMGATAFQKGLGAMHAMAHPVGAVFGAHHGLTNAVFMPYVLRHNEAAVSERLGRLAGYIGLQPSFAAFLDWVLALREAVGIPHTAESLGLTEAGCAELAPLAAADPSGGTNPVPLTAASLEGLYRASLAG
ncbi:MAG: alcohol dehydrogenase class IV [Myxococcota bacterium]|jgi:alcohol dehydrogenase class IV